MHDSADPLGITRRERERRPLLLKGLAWSVLLHVAVLAAWPRGSTPARPRALLLYPNFIAPAQVEPIRVVADPDPAGGAPAGPPAPPAADAPDPSVAPQEAEPQSPPDIAAGLPRPVERAEPAPPRFVAPAPGVAPPGTGVAPAAGGGGSGGSGPGTGSGPGGGGTGTGESAVVEKPDESARLVTFPLPVNTPETERGEVRGRARVEVVVDESGHVVDARITQRLRLGRGDREEPVRDFPAAVDASVLEAARRLRFRPARVGGEPVRSLAMVTLSVGV